MFTPKLIAKYTGEDDFGRRMYTAETMEVRPGELLDYSHRKYKLIDGRLYDYTNDGEPCSPIRDDLDVTLIEEDRVRYIHKELINYRVSDKEYDMMLGYAEGHDLELVIHEGELKLEDTQDAGDYWAVGLKDIVEWMSRMNEEIRVAEECEEEPNLEHIEDLKKDEEIIDSWWDRINEIDKANRIEGE